jgi:hypothetical protein
VYASGENLQYSARVLENIPFAFVSVTFDFARPSEAREEAKRFVRD